MDNPTIQTDLAQILNKLDGKIDRIDERLGKLEIGQVEIKGEIKATDERLSGQIKTLDERLSGQIKALDERLSGEIKSLDTKTEQLNTRVGNVEFGIRGILIGIAVAVLGGLAMFFWMASKL